MSDMNEIKVVNGTRFFRKFMIWCIGSCFLLAFDVIVFLNGKMLFNMHFYHSNNPNGAFKGKDMLFDLLQTELASLIVILIVGGLAVYNKFRNSHASWIKTSIILLSAIITKLILVLVIGWGWVGSIIHGVILCILIVWFVAWLAALFRITRHNFEYAKNLVIGIGTSLALSLNSLILYSIF